MMGMAAFLLTLVSAALVYLTDREQRWRARPLPAGWRLLVLPLLAVAATAWVMQLGPGVGLMVGLWGLSLAVLLLPLWIGHRRDTFHKAGQISGRGS